MSTHARSCSSTDHLRMLEPSMDDRQYGAVPPPGGNMQGQSFAEALRKAREVKFLDLF